MEISNHGRELYGVSFRTLVAADVVPFSPQRIGEYQRFVLSKTGRTERGAGGFGPRGWRSIALAKRPSIFREIPDGPQGVVDRITAQADVLQIESQWRIVYLGSDPFLLWGASTGSSVVWIYVAGWALDDIAGVDGSRLRVSAEFWKPIIEWAHGIDGDGRRGLPGIGAEQDAVAA